MLNLIINDEYLDLCLECEKTEEAKEFVSKNYSETICSAFNLLENGKVKEDTMERIIIRSENTEKFFILTKKEFKVLLTYKLLDVVFEGE